MELTTEQGIDPNVVQEETQTGEETAIQTEETQGEETGNAGTEEETGRADERIQQLVRKNKEAEEQIKALQANAAVVPPELDFSVLQDAPAPKPADYPYQEEDPQYKQDQDAWRLQQTVGNVYQKASERAKKAAATQAIQGVAANARAAFTDFDTVLPTLQNPNAFPDSLLQEIAEVGDGAEHILYHLGKNPAKAGALRQQSATKRAIELYKLGQELTEKQPNKNTKAPPPVTSVKAKTTNVAGLDPTDPEDSAKMTAEEWARERNKQLRQKRKG
jgi:hypothetical protein